MARRAQSLGFWKTCLGALSKQEEVGHRRAGKYANLNGALSKGRACGSWRRCCCYFLDELNQHLPRLLNSFFPKLLHTNINTVEGRPCLHAPKYCSVGKDSVGVCIPGSPRCPHRQQHHVLLRAEVVALPVDGNGNAGPWRWDPICFSWQALPVSFTVFVNFLLCLEMTLLPYASVVQLHPTTVAFLHPSLRFHNRFNRSGTGIGTGIARFVVVIVSGISPDTFSFTR